MKPMVWPRIVPHFSVAPHAGAWIETSARRRSRSAALSPPTRGRGLKPRAHCASALFVRVAPHAGAWIETSAGGIVPQPTHVAPHAGAWIETVERFCDAADQQSPPTRGRGLKLPDGIKRSRDGSSPPTRGRGLKPAGDPTDGLAGGVAPHAGAWIETPYARPHCGEVSRRPPRGGVD